MKTFKLFPKKNLILKFFGKFLRFIIITLLVGFWGRPDPCAVGGGGHQSRGHPISNPGSPPPHLGFGRPPTRPNRASETAFLPPPFCLPGRLLIQRRFIGNIGGVRHTGNTFETMTFVVHNKTWATFPFFFCFWYFLAKNFCGVVGFCQDLSEPMPPEGQKKNCCRDSLEFIAGGDSVF